MHSTPRRKSLILYLKALARRLGLFWGVPGSMPISRINDDRLYIRACALAKRKYLLRQKLLIYACILPIALFMAITQSKPALAVLLILWPFVIVGTIGAFVGALSARLGVSLEIYIREEYAQLRQQDAQEIQPSMDPVRGAARGGTGSLQLQTIMRRSVAAFQRAGAASRRVAMVQQGTWCPRHARTSWNRGMVGAKRFRA